jgi:hypothetical protein
VVGDGRRRRLAHQTIIAFTSRTSKQKRGQAKTR